MTIARVNASSWSILDKLTSTQANGLDINATFAADKRAGQTETIGAVWTCTAAGRLISSFVTGADADTTYAVGTGIQTIMPGSLTAARIYRLSATGAVAGDIVTLVANPTWNVNVVDDTSSAALGQVGPSAGATDWSEFRFNGTAWAIFTSAKKAANVSKSFAIAHLYALQ